MRWRRLIFLGGAFLIILLKFAVDVIAKNVDFDWGTLTLVREFALAGAFILAYYVLFPDQGKPEQNPVRKLGFLLVVTAVVLVFSLGVLALTLRGYDSKALSLTPLDFSSLFVGTLTGLVYGIFALIVFGLLVNMNRYSRRKGARRNALIFIVFIIATSASTALLRPLDSSTLSTVLFWLAVLMAVVNSFRLPWIIEMTKREKVFALAYTFFLFILLTVLSVMAFQNHFVNRSLLYYSVPLTQFVQILLIFGALYCGMAFVSTLFHLPTAEAFERKRTEVSSLHNLSRLVTQVLDFDELVGTVTTLTLDVCEARSSWLEMVYPSHEDARLDGSGERPTPVQELGTGVCVQVAARKNVDMLRIEELVPTRQRSLRDEVLESKKAVVIDDIRTDPRFRLLPKAQRPKGSLVAVPLLSHGTPIGLLYAAKDAEYGFVRDDVDVIATFADQATIAIENSRLVKKSIERERLVREMMLAQEMQKKLLPQSVPAVPTVEIDAVSTPAFEVGGDYYDFVHLDTERIGVVVGDVSGKGVPAAFYMSEVKGIFLALAETFASPRDFLVKANQVLATSIDKHSFVSLIYAILNVRTGRLTLARAGHCPMLFVSESGVQYIRPDGLGLGLTDGQLFADVTQEYAIHLAEGDVCILYTDGLTEAHANGEEYGYQRLVEVASRSKHHTASEIKEDILRDVRTFVGSAEAHHDDLTLVVMKWKGA
jgi:sigma-B regulation protein RsbU (phosphoserine phosphatase)